MVIQISESTPYTIATINVTEANLECSEAFKLQMMRLIDDGHKKVIVSFEKVSYVDSSFLGALVASLKYAINKHADITLTHLNKDVANLLQLIRLDKVFTIYPTNALAMQQ
ncbi:MAG: STAS domain-containing protein [Chitinophagaceae bacterium]